MDWTSHNIEHELSALYDCAHGAGLAVVMPAVFTYTLEHNVMRFAQAAVRVWGCQMDFADPKRTALEGIEALRNFLISIGMPKNFAELGAKEENIEKLAAYLLLWRCKYWNYRRIYETRSERCGKYL